MNKSVLLLFPLLLAGCHASKPPAAVATPAAAAAPEVATERAQPAPAGSLQAMLALTRHHWRLAAAQAADGRRIDALFARADAPLQLDFNASMLSVGNACNLMNAHHVLSADSLELAAFSSTMRACPEPALAALDAAVAKSLHGRLALRIEDADGDSPVLVLTNAEGDVLRFTGSKTSAARYGGPGERIFLEVAAQTRPCSHPLRPAMQCLQVRELHYDASGLQVGTPGAYGNFYDAIEGYQHQDGVRNVLRVSRYTRKNVPADASKYAWVLDAVIETDASAGKPAP